MHKTQLPFSKQPGALHEALLFGDVAAVDITSDRLMPSTALALAIFD